MDTAVEAYTGPQTLAQCLLQWPPHLLLAITVGALASVIPLTGILTQAWIRVASLVFLLGSAAWLAFTVAVVASYAVVMRHFD